MSRYLPEDIISNILSRLPPRSIQRFRCVCKSWFKLFNNPNFIKHHLKYTNQNKNSITNLLIRGDDKCMYISRNINPWSSSSCVKANEIDIPIKSPSHTLVCLGSCQGLVCLDVDDSVIWFWNPTTNDYKKVSKPESCYSSKIEGNPSKWPLVCGLGYDSNNEDYKFVMISYTRNTEGLGMTNTEVNVYSLRKGSWKTIEYNICSYLATDQPAGVFLNGVLHWLGNYITSTEGGRFKVCHDILAFDVRNDTFSLEIQKPKELDRYSFPKLAIRAMGDRLCIFCNIISPTGHCLHLWVMKDYGLGESWTKMYTVVNKLLGDELPITPIHILQNGDILLEKDRCQKTSVLYDSKQESSRVLEISGVAKWLGIETYLESLVSPKSDTEAEEVLQENKD